MVKQAGDTTSDGRNASGNAPLSVRVRGIPELWTGRALLRDAAVCMHGGTFTFVGASTDAPRADQDVDGSGLVALPGLVDPHTHLVFAGSRAVDFERRLAGESYSAILEAGGGIHRTVRATQAATDAELLASARARMADMRAGGVLTMEVKSGYGLTPGHEARMLRLAREAAVAEHLDVVTTFLGAHARPAGRPDYVDEVVTAQLDACLPWADAIDVYCDRGAFTLDEARRVLEAGASRGLQLHVHAEQVAHTGVAAMAARMGARAASHLEQLDDDGIAAMAEHGTHAILLPGAMLYLKDPAPPVARMRAAGIPLAIGTDFNPGSSPVRDLLSCATLACVTMGLTVEEALAGITLRAADALARPHLGRVEVGAQADLVLYAPPPGEPPEARVLVQYLGGHRARHAWKRGRQVIAGGRDVTAP